MHDAKGVLLTGSDRVAHRLEKRPILPETPAAPRVRASSRALDDRQHGDRACGAALPPCPDGFRPAPGRAPPCRKAGRSGSSCWRRRSRILNRAEVYQEPLTSSRTVLVHRYKPVEMTGCGQADCACPQPLDNASRFFRNRNALSLRSSGPHPHRPGRWKMLLSSVRWGQANLRRSRRHPPRGVIRPRRRVRLISNAPMHPAGRPDDAHLRDRVVSSACALQVTLATQACGDDRLRTSRLRPHQARRMEDADLQCSSPGRPELHSINFSS